MLYLLLEKEAIKDKDSLEAIVKLKKGQKAIGKANAEILISTKGLSEGKYKLYAVDNEGNVSSSSAETIVLVK